MKSKILAATIAAVICVGCVPLISGCDVSTDYTLNYDEDGNKYYTVKCSGYTTSLTGEYEIPAYYGEGEDYAPVREIADQGFASTSLSKIIIPSTITKIGTAAFSYSGSLRSVEFATDSELTSIPWGAFGYCELLTSITIPESVTLISGMAFYSCTGLYDVSLPSGLEGIAQQAFAGCTALTSIILPESLVSIGAQAFYQTGLTSIVIPDSVRDIEVTSVGDDGNETTTVRAGLGYGAFHSCTALKTAVVGKGVTTLKSGVFGYCTALEEIWLPKSITAVEGAYYSNGSFLYGHAFHNDTALTTVYYAGTTAEWNVLKGNIVSTTVVESSASYNNSALLNATIVCEREYEENK
jgi:hypothetical protein